jgi:hypothetical protein
MSNYIEKGFNSVYKTRVHCPICKEVIHANALICPHCLTDFSNPIQKKRTNWQVGAMRFITIISVFFGILISLNGQIVIGIFVGFFIYGLGHLIVQKIQSLKNYYH